MGVRECIVDPIRWGFRWRSNQESKLWARRFGRLTFATAGVAQTVDITFPSGAFIEGAFIVLGQNFAGGGAGSATFSIGTTAAPTAYVNAANVFTGAAAGQPLARAGATIVPGTPLNAANPALAATVRFTLTADVNTNLLTTGFLDAYMRLRFLAMDPA